MNGFIIDGVSKYATGMCKHRLKDRALVDNDRGYTKEREGVPFHTARVKQWRRKQGEISECRPRS